MHLNPSYQSVMSQQNLISVLRDLGTRVHRVLLEHIRSYQFSDLGGIQLTCDLNEYDKAFSLFSDTFVSELMETLKELARLLVVRADSVPQLISEGRLVRTPLFRPSRVKQDALRALNPSASDLLHPLDPPLSRHSWTRLLFNRFCPSGQIIRAPNLTLSSNSRHICRSFVTDPSPKPKRNLYIKFLGSELSRYRLSDAGSAKPICGFFSRISIMAVIGSSGSVK